MLSLDELKALQAQVRQRLRRPGADQLGRRPRVRDAQAGRPRRARDGAVRLVRREPARADQRSIAAARALALIRGRDYVLAADVEALVRDAFRHRLVLSYQALAEEVDADMVLDEVLEDRRDAADRPRRRAPRRGVKGLRRTPSGAERTPAAARAPGRSRGESLRALELAIGRRVDGLLAGDYRSAFAGLGSELLQVRPYEPGDDVRRIDWNVTARTGTTHVRVELAERVLVTWLVFDSSASMAFGTADRRKADVAEGVALAVGHVADAPRQPARPRRVRAGRARLAPAAAGPARRCCSRSAALREVPTGKGSLGEALRIVDGLAIQRSLVVIVSDFRGPIDWHQPLLRVAGRHPTVAVEIRDPREQELADVGELRLVDPETGRQLRVDTSERAAARAVRGRRRRGARRASSELLASAGVRHVALSTEGDWLRPLAAFLKRSARRRR